MAEKTLLILGAKSDIAEAIAYRFAKAQYNLILAARNVDALINTKSDIEIRHKVQVHLSEFDATDFSRHETWYKQLPSPPDVVLLAFGYLGNHALATTDFNEAKKIIDANYTGAVSILNEIACNFEAKKSGTIVAISSVAGDRGRGSNYYYGSAKAALSAYLSGLRNRLFTSGVHVLTVKPGFVQTKMLGNMQTPEALTALPEQVAEDVYQAFIRKKNTVYTLWIWRYIMLIIKNIPEFVFKNLKL